MIQVKRCEMILMNKTSHHIFEKATILSRFTLKAYLNSVCFCKKNLLALFCTNNRC